MDTAIVGSFGIFGFLFLVFLVILWTLLPFAVFGIKQRQDAQTKVLQDILKTLNASNVVAHKEAANPLPVVPKTPTVEKPSVPDAPEAEVSIGDLYADPAKSWFKKN